MQVNIFHSTILPLLLMLSTPASVVLLWFTVKHLNGDLSLLWSQLFQPKGIVGGVVFTYNQMNPISVEMYSTIFGYFLWVILLMVILPGKLKNGPVSPKGNIPIYKDNGFFHFCLTMAATLLLYIFRPFGINPIFFHDHFDEFLKFMIFFSLFFCLFLLLKGLYFPSSSDHGSSGNVVFDYYWGTELYPRVFGIDIKVLTNCRFGMTIWGLLVMINAMKSYQVNGQLVDSMFVSTAIQLFYIFKFFWWEFGYMNTIDIMVDRAGYYICWGCLVWIPGFYALPSYYLAHHPVKLGNRLSGIILLCGLISVTINYWADHQKIAVRQSDGQVNVWGCPAEIIRAKYQSEDRREHSSILLASGFWGISRHFHYLPELALAFCWSVPALFTHLMPYLYVIFLTVLLTHRTFRDDEKCGKKYGKYWDEYTKLVPYRMVPFVF